MAERLRLSFTDPLATPQAIRKGVDFLGYIVRPDCLLVRRRVVHRLKARLRDYEQKLVRPQSGHTLFRLDPVTLARLRTTWASYRAHVTMANTHRLWERLLSRCEWVCHFFALEEGLLVSRPTGTPMCACLKDRYQFS